MALRREYEQTKAGKKLERFKTRIKLFEVEAGKEIEQWDIDDCVEFVQYTALPEHKNDAIKRVKNQLEIHMKSTDNKVLEKNSHLFEGIINHLLYKRANENPEVNTHTQATPADPETIAAIAKQLKQQLREKPSQIGANRYLLLLLARSSGHRVGDFQHVQQEVNPPKIIPSEQGVRCLQLYMSAQKSSNSEGQFINSYECEDEDLCPVKNWLAFKHLLPSHKNPFATSKGNKTHTEAIVKSWRSAAEKAGVETAKIKALTAHSIKRGFTCAAKANQVPIEIVRMQQGWKPNSRMPDHYSATTLNKTYQEVNVDNQHGE